MNSPTSNDIVQIIEDKREEYPTAAILKILFPVTAISTLLKFVEPLKKTLDKYEINTVSRKAAFIAQIGHESGGFRYTRENLNYSKEGLLRYFSKYFPTPELADKYKRNAAMIASRVYANRMGNGPEESGDGYRFCGRGLIQLTGRNNYTEFAKSLGITVEEASSYLETVEGACISAGWYWDRNKLNVLADIPDFVAITKKINGGLNGQEEREKYYMHALTLLK